jgi:selenium metabolism protein YedF
MAIQVDARGLSCPTPVIKTKNVMEKNPEENIITIVNNEAARDNVKKLAENLGYQVNITERDGDSYLSMTKSSCEIMETIPENSLGDYVIYVPMDKMGHGSDDLGKVLIKGYFYALTEAKPYPKTILFINSGVNLTTEGSEVLEHIKLLANQGVEILSCGTCLDFFGLKDKLVVGAVTNMYTIVEKMNEAAKVIRI